MTSFAPPGISVNPLEDIITPAYVSTLKSMSPKFLRYPEGELSQNYYWATAPTWNPSSAQYINKNMWPATEAEFYTNGSPRMFNLSEFLGLCSDVNTVPIIIVPLNAMFGPTKISYDKLSTNAKKLVEYVKSNEVIFEIGNESTMKQSYNGNTDVTTYAKFARLLIRDMRSVRSDVKCIVNGDTTTEWNIVSKIPGIIGVVVHNYPCYSVEDWMKTDGNYMVKKVNDCRASSNGKNVYVTETSSTNFTPQENTVALSLMNIDILLRSMLIAPKCVANWATRWNYKMPIKPNMYCALDSNDQPTCLGHMFRLMTFAMNEVSEWTSNKYDHKNSLMKQSNDAFIFSNIVTKKSSTVIINKTLYPVSRDTSIGTIYSLHGEISSKEATFETYESTGTITLKPMSLTVIIS